jgi:hypothetical protein
LTQNQNSSQSKTISNYLTFIVLIVVVIAVTALFLAVGAYFTNQENLMTPVFLGLIGFIALALSFFILYQSRRQTGEMKIEIPKVMTTIECKSQSCKNKTTREFQRGDFVFKEVDTPCQKCNSKQIITAIYKEVKEKEKNYGV